MATTAKPAVSSTSGATNETINASAHAWEEVGEQAWETAVQEDADGRIIVAGGESTANLIRRRRKRLEQNDYAQRNRRVVRDLIRYLYVLIDCSRWVRDKDPVLPPGTRIDAMVSMLQEFVQEYYDQNPLSHLGFVLLKNGEAEILTQLSSSSKTHKLALQSVAQLASSEGPKGGGEFSLQNGVEVAGRSLGHQPRHGSREILILCGALSTCDPGQILTETLPRLQAANIRVSTLALAAEMHVCRKIAQETGGAIGVCLDKAHLRDWLMGQCVPPPALRQQQRDFACEMVQMGFPTRTKADIPTLVHATRDTKLLARTAYTCPQCQAKVSELPTDCVVCGLKLVLSPHLARSFHHLFPVAPFPEVPKFKSNEEFISSGTNQQLRERDDVVSSDPVKPKSSLPLSLSSSSSDFQDPQKRVILNSKLLCSSKQNEICCFACLRLIGVTHPSPESSENQGEGEESLRFQCEACKNIFCVDCDTFLHETVHTCPGCLCCY
jgi:transcription initiation factor TFIIH subunit 2